MLFLIHVGAHKTATTHLQLSLAAQRAALRKAGVRFFGPSQLRTEDAPGPLSAVLNPQADPARVEAWRERLESWLCNARRTLLSEENLPGTFTPELLFGPQDMVYPQAAPRLERLMVLAGGHPATLLLGVRHPLDFVTSAYGMRLNGDQRPGLARYLGDFSPQRIRWSDLAGRLLAVPGVERLVVWRFEDYPGVRPAILAEMVGPEAAGLVGLRTPDQVGWSQAAYRHLRWNYYLSWKYRVPRNVDRRMALAREAKVRFPKGLRWPGMVLFGRRERAAADAAYARDWDALRALPRVTALQPGATVATP